MRIQLVVSNTQYSSITELKEKTGSSTMKELLNNALTLLDWAVKASMQGASICSIHENGEVYKELQMPALTYAAQSARGAAGATDVTATEGSAPTARAAKA